MLAEQRKDITMQSVVLAPADTNGTASTTLECTMIVAAATVPWSSAVGDARTMFGRLDHAAVSMHDMVIVTHTAPKNTSDRYPV